MKFLLPLFVAILTFSLLTTILKLKRFIELRHYKYRIKGKVDEIILENNKLYFNIKWLIPEKFENYNPQLQEENIQYYHHYIKKVEKFSDSEKEREFINNYINQYVGQNFYLKAQIEKGTIRNLCAYENPLNGLIMYGLLSAILTYLLIVLH